MKKTILLSIVSLCVFLLSAQDQEIIAAWTFDGWTGNKEIPEGQFLDTYILPDDGLQKATAKLGVEQMFDPDILEVSRKWSAPSAAGYIRCSNDWLNLDGEERYLQASFSTTGLFNVSITSSHATSGTSSEYQYAFIVQYRIGEGEWTDFDPVYIFDVTEVSETGINYEQVSNLILPAEATIKQE